MTKAIVLFSGGLDSMIAARMLMDQGIDVQGIYFKYFFFSEKLKDGEQPGYLKAAAEINLPLKIADEFNSEMIPHIVSPKHGRGKHINHCIDCRIFNLLQAKEYMDSTGASFLITGEVLGQRPMSQRKDAMRQIDKATGLGDIILRPLSAKLLPKTLPEREKLVDRSRLLDIQGRSRKRQIALAKKMKFKWYSSPGGGCLLTDENYARRLGDLIENNEEFTPLTGKMMKYGRHFRNPSTGTRIIVGKNEEDNENLLKNVPDNAVIVELKEGTGPIAVIPFVELDNEDNDFDFISSLIAFYAKKLQPGSEYEIKIYQKSDPDEITFRKGVNKIHNTAIYMI